MKRINNKTVNPISRDLSDRISFLKLILSIMVIFIHNYTSITPEVKIADSWVENIKFFMSYSIPVLAVPVFFILSSFLLYRKPFNWKDNIKKKCISLGIPYLLIITIWISVFAFLQIIPFFKNFFNNSGNLIRNWNFLDFVNAYTGFDDGYPFLIPMWFLSHLLILNLFSKIILKIVEFAPYISLILTILIWCTVPENSGYFLIAESICFWITGAVITLKNIHIEKVDKIPPSLSFVFLIIISLFVFTLREYNKIYLILYRLSVFLLLPFLWSITNSIKNFKFKNKVLKVASYSFEVYLFHEFTLTTINKIFYNILPKNSILHLLHYLSSPIIVMFLCIVFSITLQKFTPRFHKILTGGLSRTKNN